VLPPKPATPVPQPRLFSPLPSSDPLEPPPATTDVNEDQSSSQETNKENTTPAASLPQQAPTQDAEPLHQESDTTHPKTAPGEPEPGTLPAPIIALMNEIISTLTASFPLYPPHTIQRLSELVLQPRQHYRSLPSYLHALDRVVHVTSGSNIYPLPPAIPDMSAMAVLTNGAPSGVERESAPWANGASAALNVGSDEALGGALLTPIPWLQRRAVNADSADRDSSSPTLGSGDGSSNGSPSSQSATQSQQQNGGRRLEAENTQTIEGPNGMGSIETVTVSMNHGPMAAALQMPRGVTQGELLRQEQRAGVVPVSQLQRATAATATAGGPGGNGAQASSQAQHQLPTMVVSTEGQSEEPEPEAAAISSDGSAEDGDAAMTEDDEVPHARGPEEIGAADTGPQHSNPGTSITIDESGIAVKTIDIPAAVGRSAEEQIAQSREGGTEKAAGELPQAVRAATPKREAEDAPEEEQHAAKKRKESVEDDEGAADDDGEKKPGSGEEEAARPEASEAMAAAEGGEETAKPGAKGDVEMTGQPAPVVETTDSDDSKTLDESSTKGEDPAEEANGSDA